MVDRKFVSSTGSRVFGHEESSVRVNVYGSNIVRKLSQKQSHRLRVHSSRLGLADR